MFIYLEKRQRSFSCRIFSAVLSIILIFQLIISPAAVLAQSLPYLPNPGTMVNASPAFTPVLVKGLTIYPQNPLQFDFIVDSGDEKINDNDLKTETNRLIKYFLASLTVPEEQMWVNLSPYEKDRIIPEGLGVTELGRDLLAQDYLLKQLAASLIYPEKDLGRKFWDRVYRLVKAKYKTTEIPVNTFNKVWIVPDKATVYEHGSSAFVVESHLKVMLEEDYVALNKTNINALRAQRGASTEEARHQTQDLSKRESSPPDSAASGLSTKEDTSKLSSDIIREIIIPEIEKEVNEGRNFAQLRQIYYAMVLAVWYKQALRESILTKVYADQKKVAGIDLDDKDIKEKIYAQYLEAFKKGVYNFIKEDYDPASKELVPRKYFSGGFAGPAISQAIQRDGRAKDAQVAHGFLAKANLQMALPGETVTGKMKQIGQRKKDAPEQDLSQFHGAWAKAAAKAEAEEIIPGVTARVIVEPAAMFNLVKDAAYYFHSPKYGWIIVLNDTLTYEVQQEAKFHEAIEIQLRRKIAAKKKAGKEVFEEEFFGEHGIHVIASAVQRKKFSTDGRLTPYDESQLKGMSLDGLKKLAQEYEDGREWHKEVFQRWKTINPVHLFTHVKIADSLAYDEEFYAHALAYEESFFDAVQRMIHLATAEVPQAIHLSEDQLMSLAGENVAAVGLIQGGWKQASKNDKDELFENWIEEPVLSARFVALLLVYNSLRPGQRQAVFERVHGYVTEKLLYDLQGPYQTLAEIFKLVPSASSPESPQPPAGPVAPAHINFNSDQIRALSSQQTLELFDSVVYSFFQFAVTASQQKEDVAKQIEAAKAGGKFALVTLIGIYSQLLDHAQREAIFRFVQEWVSTHNDKSAKILAEIFGLPVPAGTPSAGILVAVPKEIKITAEQVQVLWGALAPLLAADMYIIQSQSAPQQLATFDGLIEQIAVEPNPSYLYSLLGSYYLLTPQQKEKFFVKVKVLIAQGGERGKVLAEIFGLSVPATSATAAAAVDWTTAQPLTLEMKRDTGITVTPDFIVSQDKKSHDVILLDARTGKKISTFQGHKNQLYDAAFSADKKLALTFEYVKGNKSTVRIWETATGKEVAALPHDSFVYKGVFSPDGKWVVTSQSGGGVQVWDLAEKKILKTLEGHAVDVEFILFSPDGRRLVTSGINAPNDFKIWDTSTFARIPVKKYAGQIFDLGLSADGKTLAVVYRNGRLALWDTGSGELSWGPEKIHKQLINTVKFSGNGQWLVTSSLDGTAVVWDRKKNKVHHVLEDPDGPVYDADFSSDGKYVVTASGGDHSHVRVWLTQTGKLIKTLSVSGDQIGSVTFSSDGKNIIAKGDDNMADVYAWQGQGEVAVQSPAPVLPAQPVASAAPQQINISEQDVLEKVLDGNYEYLNMAKAIKNWLSQKTGNKDGILGLYIDEALQGLKIDLARLLLLYNDLDPGQQQRVFAAIQTLIAQGVPSAQFLAEIFGLSAPASAQKEPQSPAPGVSAQSAGAISSEKILQAPLKIDVSSFIKKLGGPKSKSLVFYIKDPKSGVSSFVISPDLKTWGSWDTQKRTDFFRGLIRQAQHGGYLWELLYLYNHLNPAQQKEVFETAVLHVHEGWDQHGVIAQIFGWDHYGAIAQVFEWGQTLPSGLVAAAMANMPQIPLTLDVSELELAELLATFKEVEVLEKLKQEIPDEVLTAPGKVDIEGNSKYRHTMAMASSGGPWLAYFILVYNKLHQTEKRHVYNQAFSFIRKASAQQRPQAEFVAKIFGLDMPAGKTVSKAGESAPQPAIDPQHLPKVHLSKDQIIAGLLREDVSAEAQFEHYDHSFYPAYDDHKNAWAEIRVAALKGELGAVAFLLNFYFRTGGSWDEVVTAQEVSQLIYDIIQQNGPAAGFLRKVYVTREFERSWKPHLPVPAPVLINISAEAIKKHVLIFSDDIKKYEEQWPGLAQDLPALYSDAAKGARLPLAVLLTVYNDTDDETRQNIFGIVQKLIRGYAGNAVFLAKVFGLADAPMEIYNTKVPVVPPETQVTRFKLTGLLDAAQTQSFDNKIVYYLYRSHPSLRDFYFADFKKHVVQDDSLTDLAALVYIYPLLDLRQRQEVFALVKRWIAQEKKEADVLAKMFRMTVGGSILPQPADGKLSVSDVLIGEFLDSETLTKEWEEYSAALDPPKIKKDADGLIGEMTMKLMSASSPKWKEIGLPLAKLILMYDNLDRTSQGLIRGFAENWIKKQGPHRSSTALEKIFAPLQALDPEVPAAMPGPAEKKKSFSAQKAKVPKKIETDHFIYSQEGKKSWWIPEWGISFNFKFEQKRWKTWKETPQQQVKEFKYCLTKAAEGPQFPDSSFPQTYFLDLVAAYNDYLTAQQQVEVFELAKRLAADKWLPKSLAQLFGLVPSSEGSEQVKPDPETPPAPAKAKTPSAGAKAPAKIDVSQFITKHQGKDFWNINEGSVQALIDFQAEQDLWANMDDPDEKSGYFEHKLATAQKGDFQDLLDLVAVYNDYLSDEQQAQVFAAVKAYVASGGAVGKMLAKLFGLPGPAELVQPQPASKQPAPAKLNIVAPEVHKLFFKNADPPTITQAQQDIAEFKSKPPGTKARQKSLKEWLEGLDLEYLAQEYLQEDVQFIIYRMSLGELLLVYNDLQPAEQSQVYAAFLKIIEAGAFGEEYLAKVTGFSKLKTKVVVSSKSSAKPLVPAVDWTKAVPLDWGLPKNQGVEITPDFIVTQDPLTFAVTLRDTGTGQVISTFKGHTHTLYDHGIAFSADKKLAVTFQFLTEEGKLVHKSIVRVWETATGKEVAALEHKQHVYSAAFSVDGKYLVTGEGVSEQDNQVVVNVWDLQTKTIKKQLPAIGSLVRALLFSSDGRRLVSRTVNQANGFNIWDMQTLAEVPVQTKYEGEVYDAALSPDGKSLAVSYRNGTMAIWSTENGAQVVAPQALHKTLGTLSFSPDGNWIVIASWDMKVTVWDVKKQQVHKVLEGHTGLLASGIAFTADSKYVATSSGNSTSEVMIWEVQSGNLVKKLTPVVTNNVTFSADGKNIIVKASGHSTAIDVWQAPPIVSAAGPDVSPSKIKVTDAQVAMVMGPLHHPQGVMVVKEEIKHFTSLPKANQRAVIEATLESIEDSLAQGTWTVDARFSLGKMLLLYNQLKPDYQFYLTRLVMNWVDSGGPESAVLAEIFGLEYKEEPPAQPAAVLAEVVPAQIKVSLYDIYQLLDSPHMSPPQIAGPLQQNLLTYQTGTEEEQTKLLDNLIEHAASGTRGVLAHLLFLYNYVSDVEREKIFNFLSDMMAKSAWPQNIADFVRKAFSATPQAAGFPQEIHFTFEEAWQELLPGMDKDQLRYMLMDDWQQYEKLSPNQQKAKVFTLINLQSKNGEVTPINALKLLSAYNLLPSEEKQKVFHFLQEIISKQHVGHEYFARVLKKYSSPAAQEESMGLEFNPGYDIHISEVMEFLGNSKDKFWAYDSVVQGGILTSSNTLQVSKLKKYLAAAASEDAVAMAVLLYLLPFVSKEYQTQILKTAREWVALGRAGGDVLARILKFSSGPPQPKAAETVQPVVDDKSGVQPDDRAAKILASVPEDLREYFSTQPLAVAYIYPFLPASAAAEFVVFWLGSLRNGASLAPLVLGELYPLLHKSERAEVRELLRNDFKDGKKGALIAMGKIVSWLDSKKDRDGIYKILIKFAAQQIPGALIGLGHAIAAPGLNTLDPQRRQDAIRHLFQLAREGNDAAAVGLAYARKALTDQQSNNLIANFPLFDVPKKQLAFFEMLGQLMPEMSSTDRDRYFNDDLLPAAQNFNHAALEALGEVYHVLSSAQQDQAWAILQQGVKQDKGSALIAVARIYQRTRTEYEKKQSPAVEPDSVAITLDSSLKDLGLFYPGTYPNPFYHFLEAAGIDTVGDLIGNTEGQLLVIPHIGPKSIEIIKQKLKAAGGWTLQGEASPADAPLQIDMLETEIASAFLSVETDSLEGLIFTAVGELWTEQETPTGKSELVERLLQNDALYSRLSLALLIQLYPLLGQGHKVETTALIIRWVQEGKPGHEALAKIFNIKTAPAFVFSDAHFDPKKAKEYAQAFLEGNPTLVELFAKFSGYYVKDEGVHDADIAKAVTQLLANFNKPSHVWLAALAALYNGLPRELQVKVYAFMRKWIEDKKPGYQKLLLLKFDDKASEPAVAAQSPTSVGERIADLLFADDFEQDKKYLDLLALYYSADANGKEKIVDMCVKKIRNDPRSWEPHFWGVLAAVNNVLTSTQKDIVYPLLLKAAFHEGPSPELLRQALANAFFSAQFELPLVIHLNDPLLSEILNDKEDWQEFLKLRQEMASGDIFKLNVDHIIHLARDGDLISLVFLLDSYARLSFDQKKTVYKLAEDLVIDQAVPEVGKIMAKVLGLAQLLQAQPLAPDKIQISEPQVRILLDHHQDSLDVWEKTIEAYTKASFITIPSIANTLEKAGTGSWLNLVILLSSYQWLSPDQKDQVYDLARVLVAKGGNKAKVLAAVFGLDHLLPAAVLPATAPDKIAIDIQQVQQRLGNMTAAQKFIDRWNHNANGDTRPKVFEELKQLVLKVNSEVALMAMLMLYNKFSGGQKAQTFKLVQEWVQKSNPHTEFVIQLFGVAPVGLLTTPEPSAVKVAIPLTISFKQAQVTRVFGNGMDLWNYKRALNHYWSFDDIGKEQILDGWMAAVRQGAGLQEMMALVSVYSVIDAKRQGMVFSLVQEWVKQNKAGAEFLAQTFGLPKPVNPAAQEEPGTAHRTEDAFSSANFQYTPLNAGIVTYEFSGLAGKIIPVVYSFKFPADLPKSNPQLQNVMKNFDRFERINFDVLMLLHKESRTVGDFYEMLEAMRKMVKVYLHLFKNQAEDPNLDQVANASDDLAGGRNTARIWLRIEENLKKALKSAGDLTNDSPLPEAVDKLIQRFDGEKSTELIGAKGAENYTQAEMEGISFAELINIVHQKGVRNLVDTLHKVSGAAHPVDVKIHLEKKTHSAQKISVNYYDARQDPSSTVAVPALYILKAFAKGQLIHQNHKLFDPEQAVVLADEKRAIVGLKLGYHSARIQFSMIPVQEGGRVQINYTDSGEHYDPGSSIRIKALARALEAAGFKVNHSGYVLDAYFDKDTGAVSIDQLPQMLEFAVQLLTTTKDVDLGINAGPLRSQKNAAGFLADLMIKDGYLQKANSKTKSSGGGPINVLDNLSNDLPVNIQHHIAQFAEFLGLDIKKIKLPIGQRFLDLVNERFRLLLDRGAITVTAKGEVVKVVDYERAAKASPLSALIQRLDKMDEASLLDARRRALIARTVQDFSRRQIIGSIGGYLVEQLVLPALGDQITFYVLKDGKTGEYDMAWAVLGEFFYEKPRFERMREEQLPHNELSAAGLQSLLRPQNMSSSESLKKWLRSQKISLEEFETKYQDSVFKLMEDQSFLDRVTPSSTEKLSRSLLKRQPVSPVAFGGVVTNRGVAIGKAVLNNGSRKASDFVDGILISQYTESKDDDAIKTASGIVVTSGGPLSHSAVRAQEHKKPALILNGALVEKTGLVFKIFKGTEQKQTAQIKGQKIAYAQLTDYTQEDYTVEEGDLLYLDAQNGLLYVLAKASDTAAVGSFKQYQTWKGTRLGTSTEAGKPVDQLRAILLTISNVPLLKAIINDLIAHELMTNDQMEKLLRELTAQQPGLKEAVAGFINQAAANAIEDFKSNYETFKTDLKTAGIEQLYLMTAEFIAGARALQAVLKLAGSNGDMGLTLERLKSMVDEVIQEAREQLAAEKEKLVAEVQGVKAVGDLTLLRLLRIQTRIERAGLKLDEVNHEMAERLNKLRTEREAAVQKRIGRGIIWKDDLLDRFARPLAGGKGANSGEILNAIKVLQGAGRISTDMKVVAPAGFVIQPQEYRLWDEAGRPVELDGQLQKDLVFAYRDLVLKQYASLKELIRSDPRSGEEEKTHLLDDLTPLEGLDEAERPRAIDAIIELARKLISKTLKAIPGDKISKSLRKRLQVLGAVAVRSSGLKEDSESEAMAGMKQTVLNVTGTQALFKAVVEVWRSNADGILVEEMINAKASVVGFSADSTTKRIDRMRINGALGLAKGLVDQTVKDPDSYLVNKRKKTEPLYNVVESHIGQKTEIVRLEEQGNGTRVDQVEPQQQAALMPVQIQMVAQVLEALSEFFGYQVDMEASFDADDRLVILQVRPITTLRESMDRGRAWLAADNSLLEQANGVDAGKPDRAMLGTAADPKPVGGIDLDPAQLNLERKGTAVQLNVPADPKTMENLRIEGLTPFIFQMVPITNLPMVLGSLDEEESPAQRELLSAVN